MDRLKDFPGAAAALTWLAVLGHFMLHRFRLVGSQPHALISSPNTVTLYLGAAAAVAVFAGFSGVVIIFALSPDNEALREIRTRGGERLRANWFSLLSTPTCATLLYLAAATAATAGHTAAAGWFFEAAVLLTLGAAARMLWLFHRLLHAPTDAPGNSVVDTAALRQAAEAHAEHKGNQMPPN